jgi:hypothetical protein
VNPVRNAAVHEVAVADTDDVVEPGVLLRPGPERSPVIVVRTVSQQTSASPSLA